MNKYLFLFFLPIYMACAQPSLQPSTVNDSLQHEAKPMIDSEPSSIHTKDSMAANKEAADTLGGLVTTIDFAVKTKDLANYPDGKMGGASIEHANKEASLLVDADKIVIRDTAVDIIIDYPLTRPYTFHLRSPTGFTPAMLLKAVGKHYELLYAEEERTATVKTLPMSKRKIYNRNETNGTYGIWGHDISDLVLTDVNVYRNDKGIVTLTLGIDS